MFVICSSGIETQMLFISELHLDNLNKQLINSQADRKIQQNISVHSVYKGFIKYEAHLSLIENYK